jgi:hypothetical protein
MGKLLPNGPFPYKIKILCPSPSIMFTTHPSYPQPVLNKEIKTKIKEAKKKCQVGRDEVEKYKKMAAQINLVKAIEDGLV